MDDIIMNTNFERSQKKVVKLPYHPPENIFVMIKEDLFSKIYEEELEKQ
jgi:hypothetical protein